MRRHDQASENLAAHYMTLIMHENVTNNRYYPTFKVFANATLTFLNEIFPPKARLWIDRLTDNFTPVYAPVLPTLQV